MQVILHLCILVEEDLHIIPPLDRPTRIHISTHILVDRPKANMIWNKIREIEIKLGKRVIAKVAPLVGIGNTDPVTGTNMITRTGPLIIEARTWIVIRTRVMPGLVVVTVPVMRIILRKIRPFNLLT